MTSPQPEQACVRHPNRPTGLRCVRCERPACPECLREASVGFQCVDCVNAGQRTQRRAVTVAGAELNRKPLVVPILIVLNVAAFVINAVEAQSIENNDFSLSFRMFDLWPPAVAGGDWWRMVTNGFLHFGPIHLVVNMASLFIVGRDLEVLFGRLRFTALYLVSLLGGSVAVYLFSQLIYERGAPVGYAHTVGASGAIFGLLGALAVALIRLKLPITQALAVIGLNIVITFTIPGISWLAHIGGLVTGGLVALGMLYPPAKIRTKAQLATLAAALVLLVSLTVVRDSQFPHPVECTYGGSQPICVGVDGSGT